jgi:hypothetical protein
MFAPDFADPVGADSVRVLGSMVTRGSWPLNRSALRQTAPARVKMLLQ